MDWLLLAKAALLVYLTVGLAILVVVYRRRSKKIGRGRPVRPDANPFYRQRWGFPPTPLPDWAYLDEDKIEGLPDGDSKPSRES